MLWGYSIRRHKTRRLRCLVIIPLILVFQLWAFISIYYVKFKTWQRSLKRGFMAVCRDPHQETSLRNVRLLFPNVCILFGIWWIWVLTCFRLLFVTEWALSYLFGLRLWFLSPRRLILICQSHFSRLNSMKSVLRHNLQCSHQYHRRLQYHQRQLPMNAVIFTTWFESFCFLF